MRSWQIVVAGILLLALPGDAVSKEGGKAPPSGKALAKVVAEYWAGTFADREKMRRGFDATLAPLKPATLRKLREDLLKIARKQGRKLSKSGTNYWFGKETKRGKYIVKGKPSKALFIGLHGGGQGSGDAGSAAGSMGGGSGWGWIFPEVLEKTEHGWTDSGTEEWVMELIQAAKRTWKLDPNRIYITGHSMGGFGSWHAGGASRRRLRWRCALRRCSRFLHLGHAGDRGSRLACNPGILPELLQRCHCTSTRAETTRTCPPASERLCRSKRSKELKKQWPDGFNFRYDRVEGRGHAGPKEGYLPFAEVARLPPACPAARRPSSGSRSSPWKRQFYWVVLGRASEAGGAAGSSEGARRRTVIEIKTPRGIGRRDRPLGPPGGAARRPREAEITVRSQR